MLLNINTACEPATTDIGQLHFGDVFTLVPLTEQPDAVKYVVCYLYELTGFSRLATGKCSAVNLSTGVVRSYDELTPVFAVSGGVA